MKKHFLMIAALVSAFTLAACGGSGGDADEVARADATVPVTATTVAALSTETFTFPAVPDFGTTAATSLTFNGTSATPAFNITSGSNTATGVTTFGSCIFQVTASTFPPGHPLELGSVVRVNPCSFKVSTNGLVVTGDEQNANATLTLGSVTSSATTVSVVISEGGKVAVNGETVGEVVTAPITGL